MDTQAYLGLNIPDDQKILLRHVVPMRALVTEDTATKSVGENETYPIITTAMFSPGPSHNSFTSVLNYTYRVESLESQYMEESDNFQRF